MVDFYFFELNIFAPSICALHLQSSYVLFLVLLMLGIYIFLLILNALVFVSFVRVVLLYCLSNVKANIGNHDIDTLHRLMQLAEEIIMR